MNPISAQPHIAKRDALFERLVNANPGKHVTVWFTPDGILKSKVS